MCEHIGQFCDDCSVRLLSSTFHFSHLCIDLSAYTSESGVLKSLSYCTEAYLSLPWGLFYGIECSALGTQRLVTIVSFVELLLQLPDGLLHFF